MTDFFVFVSSLFGVLLVISFCNFSFVMNQFKFLKTIQGKGYFNLFLSSMFLVGNNSFWGYLMCGLFGGFGLFFILVGCACIEGYDDADIKKEDVKNQAKSSFSKKGANAADTEAGADNSTLLDSA